MRDEDMSHFDQRPSNTDVPMDKIFAVLVSTQGQRSWID